MKLIIIFMTIMAAVILTSCAGGVVSKNIVGLAPYKIDAKQIDGVWINNKGAILLNTIDADQGIVKVTLLEECDGLVKIGPLKYQIMKGENWLYFNLLSEIKDKEKADIKEEDQKNPISPDNEKFYKWGRIVVDENKIVLWPPSTSAFVSAIDGKNIVGTYRYTSETSKAMIVKLTDSAKNIVKLVEQENITFFSWDDPDFFIKLTK
jgi:hypothetical protein